MAHATVEIFAVLKEDVMGPDGHATDAVDDASGLATVDDIGSNTTKVTVRQKFNSICPDPRLRAKVESMVERCTIIVAEAYALANFHLLRLLRAHHDHMPHIDDSFYYQCLSAVSVMNTRDTTIKPDLRESMTQFNRLRPHGEDKIDARDLMDLLPDLRIVMATAAKNHLWTNLSGRTRRWLTLRYPRLKKLHGAIVAAVFLAPTKPLSDFDAFNVVDGLTPSNIMLREKARTVAAELRNLCPLRRAKHIDGRSHELIPMYWRLFQDAEQHFSERRAAASAGQQLKRTPMKRFSILPTKAGFTASYIPISTRTMLSLVSKLKNRDGSPAQHLTSNVQNIPEEEADQIWRTWFNVNAVETTTRTFGHRILTDGCGCSVVMDKPACHLLSTDSSRMES